MHCPNCGTAITSGQRFCTKCGAQLNDPYAVSSAAMQEQTLAPSGDPPYAGFWRRAGGYFIDYILVVILYAVIFVPAALSRNAQVMALAGLGCWIAIWLYHAGMESSSLQATLGKLAVGVKVTDLAGERIRLGRATGRFFAHIITAFTLCIGYAMVAFTRRRQTLHDMIAETLVVRRAYSPEEIAVAGPAPRQPVVVTVLAIIAIVILGPFGIGVMAAIAIPAYQNYTIRVQVAEGLQAATPYKVAVAEAYAQGQPFRGLNTQTLSITPATNLRFVDSVQVISGLVVIKYGRAANRNIAQKTLLLVPGVDRDQTVVWICGHHAPAPQLTLAAQDTSKYTNLPDNYLPVGCRP